MAADARAEFDPKEIARVAFPTAFRGYDQDAVRRYLSRLANTISRAQQLGVIGPVDPDLAGVPNRESELEIEASELRSRIDELEDMLAGNDGFAGNHLTLADLDEAELIGLLGQETARILEQARSAGADIVHRAEAEADAVREQADLDARATVEEAESILSSARTEAEDIRDGAADEARRSQARNKAETKRSRELAREKADEILAEATVKAEEDLGAARHKANEVVAEAEHLREEMLGDLVHRRSTYLDQLERLSTARDRLAQGLALARSELDTVASDIDLVAPTMSEIDLAEPAREDSLSQATEVAELIAQLHGARGGADLAADVGSAIMADAVIDADAEIEPEHGEPLEVEYLTIDDGEPLVVDLDGGTVSNGSLGETTDVTALLTSPAPSTNGRGPSSNGHSHVEVAAFDDQSLGRATSFGRTSGLRGDLPRQSPFGGPLPASFDARDAAMARSVPGFRRKLKRAVNDDQSLVLDRIRGGRGPVAITELPSAEVQLDAYLEVLHPLLYEMVQAGTESANGHHVPADGVEHLCMQLGRHIVECLRAPTIEAIEAGIEGDRETVLDPIRLAYRDFRNGLLPDLIDDALHEAFALGLFSAIDDGADVLWITDPRLDPDPICEQNSASRPLLKGDAFPSGHSRPLSMPGCRCLAVPAR
ncbi:MAG: DivIVA domain-containing protein [Actinomycetota bacterium]